MRIKVKCLAVKLIVKYLGQGSGNIGRPLQIETILFFVKVSDRKYLWIKVRAFGRSKQWAELSALAKTKKSPIGFAPFVDVCLEAGEKSVAVKYLPLLVPEERLKYLVKVRNFFWGGNFISLLLLPKRSVFFAKKFYA